jgi:hypothetical protein
VDNAVAQVVGRAGALERLVAGVLDHVDELCVGQHGPAVRSELTGTVRATNEEAGRTPGEGDVEATQGYIEQDLRLGHSPDPVQQLVVEGEVADRCCLGGRLVGHATGTPSSPTCW